jgi:molybdopterin synthase sulfur carrier subunit
MTISIRIPAQIRRLYGAQSWEEVEAGTVGAMISALETRFPSMGERLTEPDAELRRWVNVFFDGRDVRTLQGLNTPLGPDAKVYIVPSVAGGAGAR